MKKVALILSVLLALAMLLSACAAGGPGETTASTTESTAASSIEDIQFPVNTAWNMTAVLVDQQGQVKETMELTAKVKAWEQEGEIYYALYFHYPENIYNSVSGVIPNTDQGKPYNCCGGTGAETGEAGKRAASLYAAFDLVKECFIADFDDGEDVYLIAYKNPNADLDALWAYFQDFIEMRPDEFPKVS